MILAVERTSDRELPLFLHVAGAMVLVGALIVVAWTLIKAWRGDVDGFTNIAFRTLLYAAIPAFLVMRVSAQWLVDKGYDEDQAWIGIGFGASDLGLLLLIVATVVAGIASRRLRREGSASPTLGRVAAVITLIPLALYLVAIWAMTTKPT